MVSVVRPYCCDYAVDVPKFGDGVLDGDVGADVDLREGLSVLVVVMLHLFFVVSSVFLRVLSTCLPFWCEGSTMSRECVLYWLPK